MSSPGRRILERLQLPQLLSWIGRFEFTTLVLTAAVAAGTWTFIELADEVLEGNTSNLDDAIILAFRNPADRDDPLGPRWVEELMRDATALGGVGVLTLLTLASAGYLALTQRHHAMWFLLATVAGGQGLSFGLKYAFDRPRPDLVAHGSHVYTASFPSGHSAMAAVTFLTIAALLARVQPSLRLKAYILLIALLLSVLVGVSRVYLGVHYASDVLAGWTLGGTWASLCWLGARWLQRRGKVEPAAKHLIEPGDRAESEGIDQAN